jgi:hypothetical protein
VELGAEVEGDVYTMDERIKSLGFGWAYPIKGMEALNPAFFFFFYCFFGITW